VLLAIDPGTDTGWALFNDAGVLSSCGLERPPSGAGKMRVLVECPKLRPREKNPQAILLLAVKAGEWGGIYREHEPEYLTPNDWKGSTSKEISHPRIWVALGPAEQGIVDRACKGVAPSKRHNVMDAIGIGLHGVGRNANGR